MALVFGKFKTQNKCEFYLEMSFEPLILTKVTFSHDLILKYRTQLIHSEGTTISLLLVSYILLERERFYKLSF